MRPWSTLGILSLSHWATLVSTPTTCWGLPTAPAGIFLHFQTIWKCSFYRAPVQITCTPSKLKLFSFFLLICGNSLNILDTRLLSDNMNSFSQGMDFFFLSYSQLLTNKSFSCVMAFLSFMVRGISDLIKKYVPTERSWSCSPVYFWKLPGGSSSSVYGVRWGPRLFSVQESDYSKPVF